MSDALESQPPAGAHRSHTEESGLPTPNEHAQTGKSHGDDREHTKESGSPTPEHQDDHREETPVSSVQENAEPPDPSKSKQHWGIILWCINGCICILLLLPISLVLDITLYSLSSLLYGLYGLYLDLVDIFDYAVYLYENDSFLFGQFDLDYGAPYFATRRSIAAAKERVQEKYDKWEEDCENGERVEPLVLEGKDMILLTRLDVDIGEVLFGIGMENYDEGDLEEEGGWGEAMREGHRIVTELGPEAVVLVWNHRGQDEEEGEEEGGRWVLVANFWDFEEDAVMVWRERMRENEEDVKREVWEWVLAVLMAVGVGWLIGWWVPWFCRDYVVVWREQYQVWRGLV
ncbi:hypothetical protein QBC40DRAFT_248790 [Triangularia verruculosa]|uniref:Uncharacterized protein n=1 Tax=Triangularia verruculosa TaxID=2587418 RepID=A0AAN6XTW4_9PEZI|nr:hypothetical protein QBC40DRAFT_248790 [Triangularia verruculosa]